MNIATEFNKCFTEDAHGVISVKILPTSGDNDKQEHFQSKFRKSIDTTENKLRVVSTS